MPNLLNIPEQKPCKCCNGTGTSNHTWIYNELTREGHFGPGPCKDCGATGYFQRPDFKAILQTVTKGKEGARTFRKSKPKFVNEFKNQAEGRAYFVWRMTRFHSGQDVTTPVCASSCVHYDPYYDELNLMAEVLAKKCFGTDMAAAYRWGNALGYEMPRVEGLPASAYSCGPAVLDNNKPKTEMPELF